MDQSFAFVGTKPMGKPFSDKPTSALISLGPLARLLAPLLVHAGKRHDALLSLGLLATETVTKRYLMNSRFIRIYRGHASAQLSSEPT